MKERQVECRYCRKQTAEQNYKSHLQQLHQEEYEKNPEAIRQYGEQTINFFKQPSVRGAEGGDRVQASTYRGPVTGPWSEIKLTNLNNWKTNLE